MSMGTVLHPVLLPISGWGDRTVPFTDEQVQREVKVEMRACLTTHTIVPLEPFITWNLRFLLENSNWAFYSIKLWRLLSEIVCKREPNNAGVLSVSRGRDVGWGLATQPRLASNLGFSCFCLPAVGLQVCATTAIRVLDFFLAKSKQTNKNPS